MSLTYSLFVLLSIASLIKSEEPESTKTVLDQQQCLEITDKLLKLAALRRTPNPNEIEQLLSTCTKFEECRRTVFAPSRIPTEAGKRAVELLYQLCGTIRFVTMDFVTCNTILESKKSNCNENWHPFNNSTEEVDEKVIKETREKACKGIFGDDDCMKKEVTRECGAEMWNQFEQHLIQMSILHGHNCTFGSRKVRKIAVFAVLVFFIVFLRVQLSQNLEKIENQEFSDLPQLSIERKLENYARLVHDDAESKGKTQFYRKRPETRHVDCGRVLNGDKEYMATLTGPNRAYIIENPHLDMSCSAIHERVNPYPDKLKPLKMGVAFARIVYRDYEFLERQVQTSYHPQNVYCFAVDRKSNDEFKARIRKLAKCLPNAHLLPIFYEFDSAGHNYNLANTLCMKEVLQFPGWNYMILLQNHAVIMKTIYEMERIYELLGGANDIEVQPVDAWVNSSHRWDPRFLRLFRNESEVAPHLLDIPMKIAKGDSEVSLSRAAVDWLVNRVNLDTFIDQWNTVAYANDEKFLSSFQVNSEYGMPGHFTDECVKQGIHTYTVSRLCLWTYHIPSPFLCSTKTMRHHVCIIGIEDLGMIAAFPNLMVNKMLPSFDYSIVDCTAELLHNRTFLDQVDHPLQEDYYLNMVNVLYHKHHKDPDFKLTCTPNYTSWEQLPYPY